MSARTVKSMRSLPSLRKALHSSSSAPKPSHLLSSQPDSARTHFQSLTIPALKQECRQRGLKLQGRKVDLIDRIVGHEQAKHFSAAAITPVSAARPVEALDLPTNLAARAAFSTSAAVEHPDSLDTYQIPKVPASSFAKDHPVSKIPKGPDSAGPAVALSEDTGLKGDTGASAGDVHTVSESTRVSTMNVDLGDGAPRHEDELAVKRQTDSIPGSDKAFLWGLGGLIAAWWGSQWIGGNKDPKTHH